MSQLDEIEARAEAASAGPWDFGTGYSADGTRELCTKAGKADFLALSLNDNRNPLWVIDNASVIPAVTGDGPKAKANAEFIAHAREDVPYLLDLVREQAAKLDAIAKVTDRFDQQSFGLETVDQTGPLADEAINDIQTLLGGWS